MENTDIAKMQNNLFRAAPPTQQTSATQKKYLTIKDIASGITPDLLSKTGLKPAKLLFKIMLGDLKVKELLQESIAQKQSEHEVKAMDTKSSNTKQK